MIEREFTIDNDIGLHARPAAKFTQVAGSYRSEILLVRNGQIGNGKSLLSILALGIYKGIPFKVRISGFDEVEAMCSIGSLIERGFNDQRL